MGGPYLGERYGSLDVLDTSAYPSCHSQDHVSIKLSEFRHAFYAVNEYEVKRMSRVLRSSAVYLELCIDYSLYRQGYLSMTYERVEYLRTRFIISPTYGV
jgi:hypothetical protein